MTNMHAAHRSRAGRQQEVDRSTIPEHRRRKEFSLVQRIEPPELLAATGAASASLSSVQDAPPPTEPAIPHAPAVAAPHAVADAGGASNAQVSPSRLPRSIMTIEKGGELSVVRTKDGHYIEKQRVPSKRPVGQRAGQAQAQARPPRSDSVSASVSGSVHASPPPAPAPVLTSTPARLASEFGSTSDFGPAAAADDPQSMDIFDDFVYLSDSPAPAHHDSTSRRYVLNLPVLATPENIAQPPTTSSPEDVHSAFSPPHSSPVKLLYVPALILPASHSLTGTDVWNQACSPTTPLRPARRAPRPPEARPVSCSRPAKSSGRSQTTSPWAARASLTFTHSSLARLLTTASYRRQKPHPARVRAKRVPAVPATSTPVSPPSSRFVF